MRPLNSQCWRKSAWVALGMLSLSVAGRRLDGQVARSVRPHSSDVRVPQTGVASQVPACTGPTGMCELVTRFLDAFNARDFDTLRSTFAGDITFFVDRPFPPQRLDGRLAAEGVFRKGFAAFHPPAGGTVPPLPPPLVPVDLQVQAFGDVAVVSFMIRRPTEVARRTLVLHRGPAGWRVVHIHASSADVAKE